MLSIDMKLTGIKEAKEILSSKALHRVLEKTVKDTAYDIRKDLIEEMKVIFDRPTPFITRSVMVRTKEYDPSGVSALIGFFGTGGKRRNPEDILMPHIEGGSRKMKPSEELLHRYWIPTRAVPLNKYGNVPGGLITQILSSLKALPEMGYMANVTDRSRKRNKKIRNFFRIGPGNRAGRHPGVWEKMPNGKIRPILLFINSPIYYPRFKFYKVANRAKDQNVQRNFNNAFKSFFVRK